MTQTKSRPRVTNDGAVLPDWLFRLEELTQTDVAALERVHGATTPQPGVVWPWWLVVYLDDSVRTWFCEFGGSKEEALAKAEELSTRYRVVRCMEARVAAQWEAY